tara:strand:- start:122 stop:538 length:417 start_codon:yes stop_codon:yes gene_type:complete
MIEKFNNIFYLIIYLAHFIIVGSYAFQLVFDTKKFLKGRGVDKTATLITRFAGSFMVGIVLMAIYIAFIRPGGLEATGAFLNLVFIVNVSILIVNFYSLKIDKTGLTKKTKNDGIYAPLVLVIMSAILCYGLADQIYV